MGRRRGHFTIKVNLFCCMRPLRGLPFNHGEVEFELSELLSLDYGWYIYLGSKVVLFGFCWPCLQRQGYGVFRFIMEYIVA
jgi:hypothetical protein